MRVAPNARRLVRIAGVVLWLSCGAPAMLLMWWPQDHIQTQRAMIWLGAFVIFGVAFWLTTAALERTQRGAEKALLAVQSLAALTMFQMTCTGCESTLLVLVSTLLGLTMRLRWAIPWIAVQTGAMAYLGSYHWALDHSIWWIAGTVGFEVFGLLIASFAASETRARKELARANAELRRARSLLVQSSRTHERLRISRELHDLVGHHLTALSLQLELASHVAGDRAGAPVGKAQELTKRLLGDVRDVVSALRDESALDVRRALASLVAGIEAPKVHLTCTGALERTGEERANVIVRSVQEMVTNAIRHARADNLWIDIASQDTGIAIEARDDGRGAARVSPGNGLAGMRERFESVGGRVEFGAVVNEGFWLRAWMPACSGGPA